MKNNNYEKIPISINYLCGCGFRSKSSKGLKIHMANKHHVNFSELNMEKELENE
jgi:hypothetical protein